MARLLVAITLGLMLLPGALAPLAGAQTLPPAITVLAATRLGDDLTIEVRANRDFYDSTIRLTSGGVTAGLPQWEKATWKADERATWTFHLLKDLDSATLVHDFFEGAGTARQQTEDIFVPRKPVPEENPTGGTARLAVVRASLATHALRVDVSNHGTADARNVLVSVEDAQANKIGLPYSQVLQNLPMGAQASASFTVAEDLRQAVISLSYENRTEKTSIVIATSQSGASAGDEANITLTTELPFREVDIGRTVDYAVTVRNGGKPSLVQLAVEGLASGYSSRFFVGGSAVPSLYLDRNQTRQVTLSITVPNAAAEVDRTLDFTTVARINETELARLPMGVAVRGVGKLEVADVTREERIPPGGVARFEITVRNTGTAPLFSIEFDSRRPYGWTVRTEPNRVDRLDPGQSETATIEVRAPDVIGGGEYTIDVAAKAGDATSQYRALSVGIDEPQSGGGWLWIVFLVLIAGVLGFAAWWKYRG